MRFECIEFKRCCFCIPLRYGLLATGYAKLMWILIILLGIIFQLVHFVQNFHQMGQPLSTFHASLISISVLIIALLGDAALTIVFIVGGHKKNPKLMKVYYYYSIVIFGLFFVAFVLLEGSEIYSHVPHLGILYSMFILRASITLGLINLCFQGYMILLTRSEIAKLENNCKFRFVNNATEGQCTMVKELCEDGTNVKSGQQGIEYIESNEKGSERVDTIESVIENELNDQANKNGNYVRLV